MITREELIKKVAQQLVDADNAFFFEPQGRKKTVVAPSDINRARLVICIALEAAADACEQQAREFASDEYATPQPVGSISERFACAQCADAIRSLIPENDNA